MEGPRVTTPTPFSPRLDDESPVLLPQRGALPAAIPEILLYGWEASVSPSVSGRVQGDLLSSAWSGRSSSPQPARKCQLLFSPSQLGCTSCQMLPRAPTSWEGEAELTFSLEKGWACPSSAHDPLKGSQLEFARELLLATF